MATACKMANQIMKSNRRYRQDNEKQLDRRRNSSQTNAQIDKIKESQGEEADQESIEYYKVSKTREVKKRSQEHGRGRKEKESNERKTQQETRIEEAKVKD